MPGKLLDEDGKAPTLGREKLQLTIGALPVQHKHKMWVEDLDLTNDCILGKKDLLEPHGCLVDFRDSMLLVGSKEFPFVESRSQSEPSCCRVQNVLMLRSCSEMVVSKSPIMRDSFMKGALLVWMNLEKRCCIIYCVNYFTGILGLI